MKEILGIKEKEFKEILRQIGKEAELEPEYVYQPGALEKVAIWRTSFRGRHYLRFGYYEKENTKEKAEKIVNTPTFKKNFKNYEIQLTIDSFSGEKIYRIYLKGENDMNEELNKKIKLLKEHREMILHNCFCYEGKEEYQEEYKKYTEQLALINSIMVDVINSYPDVQ